MNWLHICDTTRYNLKQLTEPPHRKPSSVIAIRCSQSGTILAPPGPGGSEKAGGLWRTQYREPITGVWGGASSRVQGQSFWSRVRGVAPWSWKFFGFPSINSRPCWCFRSPQVRGQDPHIGGWPWWPWWPWWMAQMARMTLADDPDDPRPDDPDDSDDPGGWPGWHGWSWRMTRMTRMTLADDQDGPDDLGGYIRRRGAPFSTLEKSSRSIHIEAEKLQEDWRQEIVGRRLAFYPEEPDCRWDPDVAETGAI